MNQRHTAHWLSSKYARYWLIIRRAVSISYSSLLFFFTQWMQSLQIKALARNTLPDMWSRASVTFDHQEHWLFEWSIYLIHWSTMKSSDNQCIYFCTPPPPSLPHSSNRGWWMDLVFLVQLSPWKSRTISLTHFSSELFISFNSWHIHQRCR